jgi:hypothetical protein
MIDVTAHAHVYGRPNGAWLMKRLLRRKKLNDVWIATREEIVDYISSNPVHNGRYGKASAIISRN